MDDVILDSFDASRAVEMVGYHKPNVECHYIKDEATLHRYLQTDAAFAGLHIDLSNFDNDDDNQMQMVNNLGRAVGNSDHYLRVLEISRYFGRRGPFETPLDQFFTGLARNRSPKLEIFKLHSVAISDQDNFEVLTPFFDQNRNIRCIELKYANVSRCIPTLISALSHSKMNRLARIDLSRGVIGDKEATDLINALNTTPGLSNLLDLWLQGNRIRRNGCRALFSLLKNPECRILSLDVSNNVFDDECIEILVGGFVGCDTLKSLSINEQRELRLLTTAGWKIISTYLSGPSCSLELIILPLSDIEDESAAFLGAALAMNENWICLDFSYSTITPTGWRGISNGLASSSTILELSLRHTSINDKGAFALFAALANNSTLKKLHMCGSRNITSTGWEVCIRKLFDSRSVLADIDVGFNNIDDEGAAVLVHLAAGKMDTISYLYLVGNGDISTDRWRTFANVLVPSSTSKLKKLHIGPGEIRPDSGITYDVFIDLVAALADNTTLEELWLPELYDDVVTLDKLVKLLCDVSNVDSLCRSNHSLYAISSYRDTQLDSLLELNKDKDKAQVVRKKLLLYFFSNVDNIGCEFGCMATSVMPIAMEWIGRDRLGYPAMFEFCRRVPELFK